MVSVKINNVKWLSSIDLSESVQYYRIRGICYGGKISAQILNWVISGSKSVLLEYINDIWIKTDYNKNSK